MVYSIIQPPFTLKFREMPKAELQSYFQWFMKVMPERLSELQMTVRESPAHASWVGDFSPASLDGLGDWFGGQVEVRSRTRKEIEAVKATLRFPITVPEEQLTNRTFSLAMDIGMYFSQVILNNLPGTKWDQFLKNKRFADYGQPVIVGFGRVPLNPVTVVLSTAYGIASNERVGCSFRELFDTWAKMKKP